jgi:hypothetical protein
MRSLLKPTLLLTFLFTALVALTRAHPADSPLRPLLTPPDGCPAPCFLGIRPGVTTLAEATAILNTSPYVENTRWQQSYIQVLYWRWKAVPYDVIDSAAEGRLWIEDDIVQEVAVSTTLAFGDVWLLLGPAERGSFMIGRVSALRRSVAFHTALYPDAALQVAFQAACPIRLHAFWDASVGIRWISDLNRYVNQQFYLPTWNNRSCQ